MIAKVSRYLPWAICWTACAILPPFCFAEAPKAEGSDISGCADAIKLIGSTAQPSSELILEPGMKQLFIDDALVAGRENAEWRFHSPTKVGAVLRPDKLWEGNSIQIRSAPVWSPEDCEWKLWYYHFDSPFVGFATSRDGIHWTKPTLRKQQFNGSLENNLVVLEPAANGSDAIIMNIVYDPDDPNPERRYKGLAGRDRVRHPVFSADGIHWTRPDLPGIASADESNLYFDRKSKLYIATVKHGGPNGRSVYLSVSADFEKWTDSDPCLIFHTDQRDQELGAERIRARLQDKRLQTPEYDLPDTYNVDVYNMAVVRYQDFYLGFPALFHQTGRVPGNWPGFDNQTLPAEVMSSLHKHGDWTGFHNIELIYSRNLVDWKRTPGRQPFLENSPPGPGVYDLQTMLATSPVIKDDEIWFYYSGLKRYAMIASGPNASDVGGICLAKLRLDGFASFAGGATPAIVTAKPLSIRGQGLHLNVNATGEIRVEVIDPNTQRPVPGFSWNDCTPLSGDTTNAKVEWKKERFSSLVGKVVQLRFQLVNADLFSFWTQ
jgi:hypothetical protein